MPLAEAPSPAADPSTERDAPDASVPLLNRELSWLAFNERVIEEAEDTSHPLLERLKFLAISQTNLDEFFMIRVAGLRAQLSAEVTELSIDGLTPGEQLDAARRAVKKMVQRQAKCLVEDLVPRLADAGITISSIGSLDETGRELKQIEAIVRAQPEVDTFSRRTGKATNRSARFQKTSGLSGAGATIAASDRRRSSLRHAPGTGRVASYSPTWSSPAAGPATCSSLTAGQRGPASGSVSSPCTSPVKRRP